MKDAGSTEIHSESLDLGSWVEYDTTLYQISFFESHNPYALLLQQSFKGDLKDVERILPRVIQERFDNKLGMWGAIAVSRKPM